MCFDCSAGKRACLHSSYLRPRTTFGQFDCNSCIALLMSSSGITPRRTRLLSVMDTASSGTDCQVFSIRADAFSGSSTKAPGGIMVAMNSVVVAPATTVTLGCVRGGRGAPGTIRTSVDAPSGTAGSHERLPPNGAGFFGRCRSSIGRTQSGIKCG